MQLTEFEFEENIIRSYLDEDGNPWFIAKDVCAVLDLDEVHKAVLRLDDDEKARNSIPTLGGNQQATVINESGLYNLILGRTA